MKPSSCILQATSLQRVFLVLLLCLSRLRPLLPLHKYLTRSRADKWTVLHLSNLGLLSLLNHLIVLLAHIVYKAALILDELLEVPPLLRLSMLSGVDVRGELAVLNLLLRLFLSHQLDFLVSFLYKFFHLQVELLRVALNGECT